MSGMNRRDFMRRTAGALATGLALPVIGQAQENTQEKPRFSASMRRKLGNTGLEPTLIGFGTGVHAWNGVSDLTRKGREMCLSMVGHAYEKGIRYFDLADMYGSHDFFRQAMKDLKMPREDVVVQTKSVAREAEVMRADLERFRKEIDTDYIDMVLMHCISENDGPNWTEKLKPCMDVMEEAKAKGQIKAHGISCHSLTALKLVAQTPWLDVILSRINPYGVKMDGEPEVISGELKKIHDAGKGVLGMKIVGEGDLRDKIPESLKYVTGLGCVDAMTIGFLDPSEIDSMFDYVEALNA